MPKLLLFAPCEKVIIDRDGLVSLITIVERLEVALPADLQLQPRTVVPTRWQTLAIWQFNPPENAQYEQMIQLVTEDGTIAGQGRPEIMESLIPGKTGTKIVSLIEQIPITEGAVTFKLLYRKINEQYWTQAATWEVTLVIVRKEP